MTYPTIYKKVSNDCNGVIAQQTLLAQLEVIKFWHSAILQLFNDITDVLSTQKCFFIKVDVVLWQHVKVLLPYCRFHLYKENKDTQEALGVIGKMLGIQVI